MKKYFLAVPLLMLFGVMFIFAGCGNKDSVKTGGEKEVKTSTEGASVYNIDPAASKVEWIGKKVTGQHNGTVNVASGELNVSNNELEAGKINLDMNSITVLDLTDAESNGKLTGHLKSDDFFSVEKNPTATFEITNVEKVSDDKGNNYKIDGNLTIKGITKNISFPANVSINDQTITAKADFDIDRTQWDIKYGSGKFFEGLGDKMIDDNFNIKFNITANKM
jgi:polyisoprenoid-binding protein YceI